MSIEHSVYEGYANTKLLDWNGRTRCCLWMADGAGKESKTTIIMDASDCRNLAASLIERAEELEAIAATTAGVNDE